MNRNVHRQIAEQRGIDIREPSTANLLIDSLDRNTYNYYTSTATSVSGVPMIPQVGNLQTGTLNQNASDFVISSLQNNILGEFTRAAVQEVAMAWNIPNIGNITSKTGDLQYSNTDFKVKTSTAGTIFTATLPSGSYTVAQALNALVPLLAAATSNTWQVVPNASYGADLSSNVSFNVQASSLALELGLVISASGSTTYANTATVGKRQPPNLMPWTYVDITCPQLTYCQDVKDATTNPIKRDVLYRWYFAWDGPPQNDTYGYSILQGYQGFRCRRSIAFPKQIKWDPIQQVTGTLNFTSYANFNTGSVETSITNFDDTANYEFQLTLLLSEI